MGADLREKAVNLLRLDRNDHDAGEANGLRVVVQNSKSSLRKGREKVELAAREQDLGGLEALPLDHSIGDRGPDISGAENGDRFRALVHGSQGDRQSE